MNIDQNECIIQVKFGLIQLVSVEPEVFLPSTIIGHVTKYCNHVVSSPNKNNDIKMVYRWKYYLVQWPETSGSQLYYVNEKIETKSHRTMDKVIFIPLNKMGMLIHTFCYFSTKNMLCYSLHSHLWGTIYEYRICPKYSDTSTHYHTCSKILTSTTYYSMLCLKIAGWVANSVDSDEMPHSAASHLGLHCLLRPVCPNTYGKNGTHMFSCKNNINSSWSKISTLSS